MVSFKNLSFFERSARVIVTVTLLTILSICLVQNIMRKLTGAPLLKITTLDNETTTAPNIRFCLQNLNGSNLGRINVGFLFGKPGEPNPTVNHYIYRSPGDDNNCATFDGTRFGSYSSE